MQGLSITSPPPLRRVHLRWRRPCNELPFFIPPSLSLWIWVIPYGSPRWSILAWISYVGFHFNGLLLFRGIASFFREAKGVFGFEVKDKWDESPLRRYCGVTSSGFPCWYSLPNVIFFWCLSKKPSQFMALLPGIVLVTVKSVTTKMWTKILFVKAFKLLIIFCVFPRKNTWQQEILNPNIEH